MYRFLLAGNFLRYVQFFRSCWIAGRYGGGKTSLAFIIGDYLRECSSVDLLVSNCPSTLCDDLSACNDLSNACIVLDESWIFLESWRAVKCYAAFLRKKNIILLLPSVFPVHAKLRYLTVQRVFNAYGMGVPIWVYEWRLWLGMVREKGYFMLWNPAWIFGQFDTSFVVCDDAVLS